MNPRRLVMPAASALLLAAVGCSDLVVYNPRSGLFVMSGAATEPLVIAPDELPDASVDATGTIHGELRIMMTTGDVAPVGNRLVEAVPASATLEQVRANILRQSENPDYGGWFKQRASQVLDSWSSAYPKQWRARAVTDGNGHFSLVVSAGKWFVFSYIDFRPRTDFSPGTLSSGQVLWMEPVTVQSQNVTAVTLSQKNAVFVK
jgi:hypothetical protein